MGELIDRDDLPGTRRVALRSAIMLGHGGVLGAKIGPPMPRWMLELGAIGIRTETELILKSRWVLPGKLMDAGFTFDYPSLEPALREALLDV